MTIKEMKEKREQLRKENDEIRGKSETEKRAMSVEEIGKVNENMRNMSKLTSDIQDEETRLTEEARHLNADKPAEEGKELNLRSKIVDAMNGGKTIKIGMAKKESRDIDYTVTGTNTTPAGLIATDIWDIVPALRDRMLLAQAGATMLTGLVGNISIPVAKGVSADWAAENGDAANGGGSFVYRSMTPKRLTTIVEISKQLLIQDNKGVEAMLQNDIVAAVASKLEATLLGGAAGSTTQPAGIFNGAAAAVDMTWDALVDLEGALDSANVLTDNAQYLMHTKLWAKAKKTVKKSGEMAGFLLDANNIMNGYKANRSNSLYADIANSAYGVAFGDFQEMVIGQWGNMEITVDPFTKAKEAVVQLVINTYWDSCVRHDGGIQVAMMK
jgi:HK97 family phage major capsid protein